MASGEKKWRTRSGRGRAANAKRREDDSGNGTVESGRPREAERRGKRKGESARLK